ncbi:sulfate adenylyltransferase [candidate division KSB1 bacterium]|nr:sulfate adenylyltransferase [candidate division KSB1 bacterium]
MAINPHGGRLVNRSMDEDERREWVAKAAKLEKIVLNDRELSDLEMIASGALSPLEGFMDSRNYRSVLDSMHLTNGLPWTIPITLSVERDQARMLKVGERLALTDSKGTLLAVMDISEKYEFDKRERAQKVFLTTDEAHPGVAATYRMGEVLLAGPVALLQGVPHRNFLKYRLGPAETRALFQKNGWKTVVGFQTRNPIHRAHEYLQKCALEMVDGLLIHPIVGETKEGDISAEMRMKCYEILLNNYYPKDRVALVVNPAAMRYAGPREAIFHAIVRKNYGCTHFIVGRDHAGVGNFYGTYDAQHIFGEFKPAELGITPLFFEHAFYCKPCGGMATTKTCPHGGEDHVFFSGTKVREMLRKGKVPPPEFTRPEVAEVLISGFRND